MRKPSPQDRVARRILLALTLLFSAACAARTEPAAPARALAVFADPGGALTFADVTTGPAAARFAPLAETPSFGFQTAAYWARFLPPAGAHGDLILEIDYRGLDDVTLFVPASDGAYTSIHSGDLLPFSNRRIPHRLEAFHVPATAVASTRPLYLRVASAGPVVFPLAFHTPGGFTAHDREERFLFGMYYGAVAVMLLYHLLLFVSLRDASYLAFVFFIGGFAAAQLIENGLAFELLWPGSPRWDNLAFPVMLGLTGFWALAFAKSFLRAGRYAPRLKRVADGLGAVSLVLAAAPFVVSYRTALQAVSALTLAVIAVAVLMTAQGLRAGSRAARFFVLAWSALIVGGLLAVLANFGVLRHSFATYYGAQGGAVVLVVLLAVGMADRINTLRRRKEQAERDSALDGLTGVANRRRFDEALEAEWQRAVREREPISLLLVDLDYFHDYNALYGHLKGDDCLRAVARALAGLVHRPGDFVARFGGEEFALLLPKTDARGAAHVAERLCGAVAELAVAHETSAAASVVTASCGVATLQPSLGEPATALVRLADAALFEAKRLGRNRHVVAGAATRQ